MLPPGDREAKQKEEQDPGERGGVGEAGAELEGGGGRNTPVAITDNFYG